MNYTITQAQVGTRPPVQLPNPEILTHLGEEGMRNLVNEHYELLKQSKIRGLFPPTEAGFEAAKKHAADFFIQICGGPRYFDESRGQPRMVARHAPFKITQEARKVWLESYIKILSKLDMDDELKRSFWTYIDVFSIWMMNTQEGSPTFKMSL